MDTAELKNTAAQLLGRLSSAEGNITDINLQLHSSFAAGIESDEELANIRANRLECQQHLTQWLPEAKNLLQQCKTFETDVQGHTPLLAILHPRLNFRIHQAPPIIETENRLAEFSLPEAESDDWHAEVNDILAAAAEDVDEWLDRISDYGLMLDEIKTDKN